MSEEKLDRIIELLEVLAKDKLSFVIEEIKKDKEKKEIYERIERGKTGGEISKELKISTGKISGILQEWELKGLLKKDGKKYKTKFK